MDSNPPTGSHGRKQKQRIPADPRNLSWADDASRFGRSYLSKFGWDPSMGLGSSGDGMKTHIKVQQKLDMMGIGAQHQRDPNGIAWKQNKEFEALLKRLNESAEQGKEADVKRESGGEREAEVGSSFVRAQEENPGTERSGMTKKRKHKDRGDPDTGEDTKENKKEKHKRRKSGSDDSVAPHVDHNSESPSGLSASEARSESLSKPRPMAHRARIRAAKRIADKPASAISEILGIAPSSSVSSSSTPAPTPLLPSTPTPDSQSALSLDKLTTSTKSVADYFKEKLLARSSSSSFPTSSSSTPSGSTTPGPRTANLGLGPSDAPPPDEDDDPPRRGIGCQIPLVSTVGQDMSIENQRQKAECKSKKRKRLADEAIPDGVSTVNIDEGDVERMATTSKKDKKQKKRQEREQQTSAGRTDDGDDKIVKKGHERQGSRDSLSEQSKKSEKKLKKKRS